ncbi:hypothetical protein AB5J72_07740 [Streptomyces sp. CG1]
MTGRLFHVSYPVAGTWRLLRRRGWRGSSRPGG